MYTVFTQVLGLFIFVSIGFALGKLRVCDFSHTKVLSKLLVYVFLPCNVFKTLSGNFTISYITGNYTLILTGLVLLLCLLVFAFFVARLFAKGNYERRIYEYALVIPNFGYMGYALALELFGVSGQVDFTTFAVAFSLYNYTVAVALLTKKSMNIKNLFHPVLLAIVLGIAVGLTGVSLPGFLTGTVDKASGCMAPISMLLTGLVTAEKPLKNLLTDKRVYPMLLLRMIVMPLVIGGILTLFCQPSVVRSAVLFCALPIGLNTVVYPKMVDENCEIGTGLALTSTALACLTLPLILHIFA